MTIKLLLWQRSKLFSFLQGCFASDAVRVEFRAFLDVRAVFVVQFRNVDFRFTGDSANSGSASALFVA